jgi:hypothetical protein
MPGSDLEDQQGGQRPAQASLPERLLVSLLALGAPAALLVLRSLDDTRLTSWQWVFAATSPLAFHAVAAGAVGLANLLALVRLPVRWRAPLLFASAYGLAACFWGEPEVIVDASRYFTQAKHLERYGLVSFLSAWGGELPAWTDLPLVPLLDGLVLRHFGETRWHVQAFTTALFAGTVALTCRLGAALWGEAVGLAAAALLLAIPYLFTQVPLFLVDVPTMFFFTLAILLASQACRRGGAGRILGAGLAVFLAAFSKYSAWPLLSVVPVMGLVHHRAGAPRVPRTLAGVALVAGLLAAAVVALSPEVYARQLALLVTYQAPGLRRWGESFPATFLFQVHPFLTGAALLAPLVALRRRDARFAIVAWPVGLLLLLQVHRIRYWVPVFPMLAILGALGLQALRDGASRRLVVACAVTSSLALGLLGFGPFLASTSAANLQRAGQRLDALGAAWVEVHALAEPDAEVNPAVSVPILDLYTQAALLAPDPPASPPSPERLATSALRFTWEHRTPAYDRPGAGPPPAAVAVITDDLARPLPAWLERRLAGHQVVERFLADDGVFGHRTLVTLYRPVAGAAR